MRKVLYLSNIPSPYRVKFFEELGKECDLTVVFERSESSERDDSWASNGYKHFNAIFCKGIKVGVDHSLSFKPLSVIRKTRADEIIVTNNMSITGFWEILYLKLNKIPYALEGDGAFCPDRENPIKKKIKIFLTKGAKNYYSTCNNHDKYYTGYGAQEERIIRYPFSSVMKSDIYRTSDEEKQEARKTLGIHEKNVIVSIGQFIHRKGFDTLCNAMIDVEGDVGVYILGGEKLPFDVKDSRIHTVGFKKPEDRDIYLKAADIFVLPTREDIWGLVINEAMAKGVPVISTYSCNAAVEMIKNGYNGYIIESNQARDLSNSINHFLILPEDEKQKMQVNTMKTAEQWTIENMVAYHRANII